MNSCFCRSILSSPSCSASYRHPPSTDWVMVAIALRPATSHLSRWRRKQLSDHPPRPHRHHLRSERREPSRRCAPDCEFGVRSTAPIQSLHQWSVTDPQHIAPDLSAGTPIRGRFCLGLRRPPAARAKVVTIDRRHRSGHDEVRGIGQPDGNSVQCYRRAACSVSAKVEASAAIRSNLATAFRVSVAVPPFI
jgi:hypothetical protein